jgi:site-specific recombinase XerD
MDVRLDSYLEGYKMFLLDQRGLSRETYRAYVNDVQDLLGFLRDRDMGVPDRAAVRSYMLRLHSGFNRASINRKISSIRGFFDFVLSRTDLGLNPFSHVRSLRKQEDLPSFLTPDEMFDLIDAVRDLRDRALLELLYSTGIRVGEVEKMNCMDLDRESGFILVMGKGSKQRRVPVGKRAVSAVMDYLRARGIGEPLYSQEPPVSKQQGRQAGHQEHQAHRGQVGGYGRSGKAREPPCHPAHLRHPHARCRRRPPRHTGDARPCKPLNNPALHAFNPGQIDGCV